MLSIGEFAKAAEISTRAVRHYEALGLIKAFARGDNNYRYFDRKQLDVVSKIRDLQGLGFTLDEIRDVLLLGVSNMTDRLKEKLKATECELSAVNERRDAILNLLSISKRIDALQAIGQDERRLFMEAVNAEVISGLEGRGVAVGDTHRSYLEREKSLYDTADKRAFLDAVKRCVAFARENNLTLGPGRGSCPASLTLFGLGFSGIDPTEHDLSPERLLSHTQDIHIDVEYGRGQIFVDYCRKVSNELKWGRIDAFKMPLIDILNSVHDRVGEIDYDAISDDDPIVLDQIRRGDIDKIFLLDYSPNALVMAYENHLPAYAGVEKVREYIKAQKILSFRDVTNIIALWRPHHIEHVERAEQYRRAKSEGFAYDFLKPELQQRLAKNHGLVLYHEDIMAIVSAYMGWDLERSNILRRAIYLKESSPDFQIFLDTVPKEVADLVLEDSQWAFCKAHLAAFTRFTKQTAILKALHPDIYLDEIQKWEAKHGFVWDDIGIKIKGVSILQH